MQQVPLIPSIMCMHSRAWLSQCVAPAKRPRLPLQHIKYPSNEIPVHRFCALDNASKLKYDTKFHPMPKVAGFVLNLPKPYWWREERVKLKSQRTVILTGKRTNSFSTAGLARESKGYQPL